MRPTTLLIAILLTLPIQLQAGSAECGAAVSVEAASQQAGAVFVGTARSVSPTSDDVMFDVDWLWKGNPISAVVKVSVSGSSDLAASAASRTFVAGRKYLVFTANSFAPFVVDTCAPHQSFVADGSVIPPNLWEALGNSTPTQPEPEGATGPASQPPSWTSMGAAALGAVLLLILLRGFLKWTSRRKQKKAEGPSPYKMRRSDKAWLAEQEGLESDKPTFAERELDKQREIWRKKRKKRDRAAEKAAKAAQKAAKTAEKQRASADS